jgi:hypothetical protein
MKFIMSHFEKLNGHLCGFEFGPFTITMKFRRTDYLNAQFVAEPVGSSGEYFDCSFVCHIKENGPDGSPPGPYFCSEISVVRSDRKEGTTDRTLSYPEINERKCKLPR